MIQMTSASFDLVEEHEFWWHELQALPKKDIDDPNRDMHIVEVYESFTLIVQEMQ